MPKERTQADKFRDAARELECDLDEEAFDRALGKIAKAPDARYMHCEVAIGDDGKASIVSRRYSASPDD